MVYKVKWMVTGGEKKEETLQTLSKAQSFLEDLSKKARQVGAYFDSAPTILEVGKPSDKAPEKKKTSKKKAKKK